jgi:hypothetical protein
MTIFWLVVGGLLLSVGTIRLLGPGVSLQPHAPRPGIIEVLFGALYTIIPIGVLMRTWWGYYGGLVLSTVMLLGFPIGTVLGVMTMKAYADGKLAFNVR